MSVITVGALDGGYVPTTDPCAYITTVLNTYAGLGYRFTSISGTLLTLTSGNNGYSYLVVGLFDSGYSPNADPLAYAAARIATYTALGWTKVASVGLPLAAITGAQTWAIFEKGPSSSSSSSSSSQPSHIANYYSGNVTNGSSLTGFTATWGAGSPSTTTGNLLIVLAMYASGTNVSINVPTGWNGLQTAATSGMGRISLFSKVNAASINSQAFTFTGTIASGSYDWIAVEFQAGSWLPNGGVADATRTSSATGGDANPTCTGHTATTAINLILAGMGMFVPGGDAITNPTNGFTAVPSPNAKMSLLSWKIVSSTAADAPSASATANFWGAVMRGLT